MKQENSDPIQVIIADDHVLYRAGVKTALSTKKDLKIIAEADNGMHLLTLLKQQLPTLFYWYWNAHNDGN